MTITLNRALSGRLEGPALGVLIAIAFVSTATAQWMPPWGALFPGQIERNLEAQGYVLTAPLMRRPGVYLADVSAGPADHQRLIIDARSGQVLERFTTPGRNWGPALAARDGEFGEPQDNGVGPPLNRLFFGPPAAAETARPPYGGRANVHIPATVSPYGIGKTQAGTKARPRSASTERQATTIDPPLPPPAPRETARVDRSGSTPPQPTETHEPELTRINSANASKDAAASAPTAQGSSAEASDTPKVTIVPPALFQ